MDDDSHARMLLRNLHRAKPADPEAEGADQEARARAFRQLFDRAVSLFARYGFEATEPLPGGNVAHWQYRLGDLTLQLELPRTGGTIRGTLRQRRTGEQGGAVGPSLAVIVAEMAFDVVEGQWFGLDGRSGIDCLVEGLLRELRVDHEGPPER